LGVDLLHGEVWPDELNYKRNYSVVLSYELWQSRYTGDPNITSKILKLDGSPQYKVFGVLPPGFGFPLEKDLYRSAAFYDLNMTDRSARRFRVLGKLKPDIDYTKANAELSSLSKRLSQQFPDTNLDLQFTIKPLKEHYAGDVRPYLLSLFGAVALILLIACVNVTNLLLSRAISREKEIAVRTAMGAGRGVLIRQLLIESLSLSLTGGILGLAFSFWAVKTLTGLVRTNMPRWMNISVDGGVLFFTFSVAVLTGILVGLLPAFRATGARFSEILKEGRSTTGGKRRHWLRNALVVSEKALALVLLIAACLMVKSFWNLQNVDLGFEPKRIQTFRVELGWQAYDTEQKRSDFFERLMNRVEALPEVKNVAMNTNLPLFGAEEAFKATISVEGQSVYEYQRNPSVNWKLVSPSYFKVMGIDVLEGRAFSDQDVMESAKVTIVSKRFARHFWPEGSPLRHRIKRPHLRPDVPDTDNEWMTIIGVVENVTHEQVGQGAGHDVYVPFAQAPSFGASIVTQTTLNAAQLEKAVTEIVQDLDPEQSTFHYMPYEDRILEKVWQKRLSSVLFTAFGILATALAALGIFSVMSYSVSRRVREMGIRRVLGAESRDILHLVMTEVLKLTVVAIIVGLSVAAVLTNFMQDLLYQVSSTDPIIFALAPIVVLLVAVIAAMMPAIRASGVNPIEALRCE
jgi:putative ABC transport system permease protein